MRVSDPPCPMPGAASCQGMSHSASSHWKDLNPKKEKTWKVYKFSILQIGKEKRETPPASQDFKAKHLTGVTSSGPGTVKRQGLHVSPVDVLQILFEVWPKGQTFQSLRPHHMLQILVELKSQGQTLQGTWPIHTLQTLVESCAACEMLQLRRQHHILRCQGIEQANIGTLWQSKETHRKLANQETTSDFLTENHSQRL